MDENQSFVPVFARFSGIFRETVSLLDALEECPAGANAFQPNFHSQADFSFEGVILRANVILAEWQSGKS